MSVRLGQRRRVRRSINRTAAIVIVAVPVATTPFSRSRLVGPGEHKSAIMRASIVITALVTIGLQIPHREKFGGRAVMETFPSAQPKFQRHARQLSSPQARFARRAR